MNYRLAISCIIVSFCVTGCAPSHPKSSDVAYAIGHSQNQLLNHPPIKAAAGAYDGKQLVKYTVMVHGDLTAQNALDLFSEILNTIAQDANSQNMWDYYNAQLSIKSFEHGVIFTATKDAGKPIQVTSY